MNTVALLSVSLMNIGALLSVTPLNIGALPSVSSMNIQKGSVPLFSQFNEYMYTVGGSAISQFNRCM